MTRIRGCGTRISTNSKKGLTINTKKCLLSVPLVSRQSGDAEVADQGFMLTFAFTFPGWGG